MKSLGTYFVGSLLLLTYFQNQAQDTDKILWDAAWSNDGSYIAVAGKSADLHLFDATTYKLIGTHDIGDRVHRLHWHPDKNILAVAAGPGTTQLIDFDSGDRIFLAGVAEGTRAIAWNHDGSLVASADYSGSITVWSADGAIRQQKHGASGKSFLDIAWHPENDEFVTLSDSVRRFDVHLHKLSAYKHRKQDVIPLCVEWHPSGKFYVIGDYGHDAIASQLQLRKSDDSLISQNEKSKAEYRNMEWTKDGRSLVSASDAIRVWNARGTLLHEIRATSNLWGIAWSPDSKYIVTSDHAGRITVCSDKGIHIKQLSYNSSNVK